MELLAVAVAAVVAFFMALFPAHVTAPSVAMPEPQMRPRQVEVIFGGDMLFDRTVRTVTEQEGGDFIFSCADAMLGRADLVVANLEGPITDEPSVSQGTKMGDSDNYTFTQPLATAALLAAHNVRLVNIGNNHIMDFGVAGARATIAALTSAGVGYFGDPLQASVAEGTWGGVRLAFINYNEFGGSDEKTVTQVREAKARGALPVVYAHWGVEYATTSPTYVRDLAHRFAEAGAVLIVGSHPHVVQEHEIYHGAHIYYSLGNFIFDQYWDETVTRGLLLDVVFTQGGVQSIEEVPITLERDRRTCPYTSMDTGS
ncbi:MAG: CapA family protein [Patescibacteria group bacterium]|nr:CapA family protein [Patescibacteria group bacterium]